MGYTNEFELGWGAMAKSASMETHRNGAYAHHIIPDIWENGWIKEVSPAKGLHVASAWFTAKERIEYTMHIKEPCLWVFCIDTGSLTFTQQGKPARRLSPFTQLVINNDKPLRLRIAAGEPVCFTSVMIFDSFIDSFLTANQISYPIRVSDAALWNPCHIDTPLVMLVMEQIRWGVRGDSLPLPAYLCKTIELLSLFAHNLDREQHQRERRYYVTWENEQKLYRVKERIDTDPLCRPSTEELCLLAEMSESKLRIAFKSLYGKTLYAYIREAVMKRAMQKLAYDELSIKNIATQCGYQNPAKFAAAFKDVHGITPSDFRKGFGL